MIYPTGAMRVADDIRLTVSGEAWDHLSRTLDARRDVLVFVWGTTGLRDDAAWSVSVYPLDDLPMAANRRTVETELGKLAVAVPQRQHIEKLDGRRLSIQASTLVVV